VDVGVIVGVSLGSGVSLGARVSVGVSDGSGGKVSVKVLVASGLEVPVGTMISVGVGSAENAQALCARARTRKRTANRLMGINLKANIALGAFFCINKRMVIST
jgi:hypothetical protein